MGVSTELDLLDAIMAAYLGGLLMMEAAAANGATDSALHANHLVAHVLIRALVRVS